MHCLPSSEIRNEREDKTMENETFDYKFYRIPKRFFKEDMFRNMTNAAKVLYGILLDRKLCSERGAAMRKKYYEDAKENAAFERCADVITSLILKYGPALKRKWNLNEWIRNIQAESLWKDIARKRYKRYFIRMMNMKSVST